MLPLSLRRFVFGRPRARLALLLLLLLALLLPVAPPAHAAAPARAPTALAAAGPTVRVRIGVTQDGITRVTAADLAGLGVDLGAIAPATLALTSLDQPVAGFVTGAHDGRFDGLDAVYFFGEAYAPGAPLVGDSRETVPVFPDAPRRAATEQEAKYTRERVYWLSWGGAPGLRIPYRGARATGELTPPADFPATLTAEQDREWWTHHSVSLSGLTQDTWFWTRLQPIGVGRPITVPLTADVPDPAPGTAATLRLEVLARAQRYVAGADRRDQDTRAAFNDVPVLAEKWQSTPKYRLFTAALPAGLLRHGANTLSVGAWPVDDQRPDVLDYADQYVNYWQVDYRRQFRAHAGMLAFSAEQAGPQEYRSAGWATPDVLAWDISDPRRPVALTTKLPAPVTRAHRVLLPLVTTGGAPAVAAGAATADAMGAPGALALADADAQGVLHFRGDAPAGARYWLQAHDRVSPPASLALRGPTGLREQAGRLDTLIVTSAELRPAAEQLAAWHASRGRTARVVDFLDVCDEFAGGSYHPRAVPLLLAWAAQHWPGGAPEYLVLFGSGHWNFLGLGDHDRPANHVPPYLLWSDPWQGEVPADAAYADYDFDGAPDVAVGRLPARDLAEAEQLVAKTVANAARPPAAPRQALLVTDNPDGAGDYPALSARAATRLPADFGRTVISLPLPLNQPSDAPAVRGAQAQIVAAYAAGLDLVEYTGHGFIGAWTHEGLWTVHDVRQLTAADRQPVVLHWACLSGYFAHPDYGLEGLAATGLLQPAGGSSAEIAASGLATAAELAELRRLLQQALFEDGIPELGRALLVAKQRYAAANRGSHLTYTMTLFGDPAFAPTWLTGRVCAAGAGGCLPQP